MKGNERILARVQEIVRLAAERAEVSVECILREAGGPAGNAINPIRAGDQPICCILDYVDVARGYCQIGEALGTA
jgi:hypothetical protein